MATIPIRCSWAGNDPLYQRYHDKEWGVPVHSDKKLFEFLLLETMQAGLSWITVLKKRDAFRQAFAGFDFNKVAQFGASDEAALLENAGIIRNRLKIRAAINNARAFLDIRQEFGTFNCYVWGFVDGKPIQNRWHSPVDVPAYTPLAETLSKDMKKRGFSFVGPTVIYAYMQATGMVNDHIADCFRHQEVRALSLE